MLKLDLIHLRLHFCEGLEPCAVHKSRDYCQRGICVSSKATILLIWPLSQKEKKKKDLCLGGISPML